MGGGRNPGFAHDPADGGVGPLPRRSARAIGDGDEAGLQRLKRLDRLPERFLHRRRLWREELERDRHIAGKIGVRSEEHTSELQSLMRISYAVFCLKKKTTHHTYNTTNKRKIKPHKN